MSMKSIQNVLLCVCINACGMMAFGGFLQSLNVFHVCFVITVHVTRNLQNPRIRRVGNPQFIWIRNLEAQ